MSLATGARDAVRERPYLLTALYAGVVNYAVAAAKLDLDDDKAVAAALHRFVTDLLSLEADPRDAAVTMRSSVDLVGEDVKVTDGESVLPAAGVDLAGSGPLTAIIAEGEVDPTVLAAVLSRLDAESVIVGAADVAGDTLAVAAPRRQGVVALRVIEAAVSDLYV